MTILGKLLLTVLISAVLSLVELNAETTTIDVDGNVHQTNQHVLIRGSYELLETLPHDKDAFTQGFSFFNGHIYEGTGLNGASSLLKLDPENPSNHLKSADLPDHYFGEGITYYVDSNGNDRIIQITWRERTAFVYDAHSMEVNFVFKYHIDTGNGEGWGITFDKHTKELIVSDGSEYLFFWDISNLDSCEVSISGQDDDNNDKNEFNFCDIVIEAKRRIKVHAYISETAPALSVKYVNELEFISRSTRTLDGSHSIMANVWFQNYLIEICPISGMVLRLYDLTDLCPKKVDRGENVLNGISVSEDSDDILYVTGKNWEQMYKIRLL